MQSFIKQSILSTRQMIDAVLADEALLAQVQVAADICIAALRAKKKILLAGNGGSAADAQHISAELVSRYNYDRPGLSAIALTTDTSALTAIGNDYSYERVFSRQVEALGQAGDVFFGISTSGNSANILAAFEAAKAAGLKTIGLTGKTGGKMAGMCDAIMKIPATETPRVQECHIMLAHIICEIIEDTLFAKEYKKAKK